MTIELSIVPTSSDGNSFTIIPEAVTGDVSDDKLLSLLQEAEESQYRSLFMFERDPKHKIPMDDLDALRSHPRGVYILLNTASTSKSTRPVFIGMADDHESVIDFYERINDSNRGKEAVYGSLGLDQCLVELNENPPVGMGKWNLAIVFPEHENTSLLFCMLLSIFDKAKGFNLKNDLNDSHSPKLFMMHKYHDYLFRNSKTMAKMIDFSQFPIYLELLPSIISGLTVALTAIREFFRFRNWSRKRKPEKPEENNFKTENFTIGNGVIFNVAFNGDNNTIINNIFIIKADNIIIDNVHIDELINYLNSGFPPESDTLSW